MTDLASLSDAELNRMAAEAVGLDEVWVAPRAGGQLREWSPATDIADTVKLAEWLQETHGWHWQVGSCDFKGCSHEGVIMDWNRKCYDPGDENVAVAHADSPARALTLAVLKALAS